MSIEEGSATYVEDISTLAQSHSESADKQLTDIKEGLAHLHDSTTLLELSVVGLNAAEAVPFDDVYAVGFYGHGVLYDIGNGMARAIVENDGPSGLTVFPKQPSYKFALRYTQLPKYGTDKDHPKLGPNTVNVFEPTVKPMQLTDWSIRLLMGEYSFRFGKELRDATLPRRTSSDAR